jgi:hypothetical protein
VTCPGQTRHQRLGRDRIDAITQTAGLARVGQRGSTCKSNSDPALDTPRERREFAGVGSGR